MPTEENFPDVKLSIFEHILEELLVVSDAVSLSDKELRELEANMSRVAHIIMHILGIKITAVNGELINATLQMQQVDTLEI